jgi:hypothetical protein
MPFPVVPRGVVPPDKNPEFFKFICPPTDGGGPIDPVTPNFFVQRNLDVHGMMTLPQGVFTFELGRSISGS